ncbi:hypothetical protein GF373_13870 [bacterium]|nr:hypothetical protein [bacterium]
MKTIMILGIGPIAIDQSREFHAGGNRAWHFTKPLLDEGFHIILVCMRITRKENQNLPLIEKREDGNLTYYNVDEQTKFADNAYLQTLIDTHQPDALIGVCGYPAARAAAVAGERPLWADIHGYPMGEAQAKAHHYHEPGYIHHFWNFHRDVLRRADRFSVTSERQRFTLLGELGAMGRLNQHTFCESLVTQIPIAWDPQTPFNYNLRQKNDPFTVSFSGGYNLWCDVDTLFQGLEQAMANDNRIHFLSTGGSIEGHDDKTYPKFQRMVEQSPYRDRFNLKGWVARHEFEQCMRAAHLGINTDLPCVEAMIGARNRITEWLARGLPILTTLATEISQVIFYKGLCLTIPMQNPDLLAHEIRVAADHPEKMQTMAEKARQHFENAYTYHATTLELLDWCKNPTHSGDFNHPKVRLDYRHPDEIHLPQPKTLFQRLRNKLKG